jgi:hypothetical protein
MANSSRRSSENITGIEAANTQKRSLELATFDICIILKEPLNNWRKKRWFDEKGFKRHHWPNVYVGSWCPYT